MKRTRLSRGKLARCCGRHASLCTCGEPPKLKRSRLNPVNRERRERRKKDDDVYGSYHRYVQELPCILADRHECAAAVGHHVKSVGAGGKDYANEVPLCLRHHEEVHRTGRETFEERHGVDLNLIAAGIAERYERTQAGPGEREPQRKEGASSTVAHGRSGARRDDNTAEAGPDRGAHTAPPATGSGGPPAEATS